MEMERNGLTKRRRGFAFLQDSTEENAVDDHDRTLLLKKSVESNRAFMNSQKKNIKKNKRNFDCYSEKSREGDDHRRNNRNRFSDRSLSSPPVILTVDEMVIGVAVPRKIRSASMKRLNTNWSFRNAGFGRGLSHHRRFLLPSEEEVTGRSQYSASPPNCSLRKDMKSHGLKHKLPKALGDSSLVQDDVEIEVVEALFDLLNQTHSELDRSKKSEMDPLCTSGSHKEPVPKEKRIKTSHLRHNSGSLSRNNGFMKKGMRLSALNDDLSTEDDNNLARSKYSVMSYVGKEKATNKSSEELCNDSKRIASEKRVVASHVVEKELEENKVEPINFGQGSLKLEHYPINCSDKSELVEDGEEPNQCKGLTSGGQNSALHTPLPFPIFGAGWPRGLPHPGFMPPFEIFMPDRNARSLTALPRPPFLLLQCTRKRCVTHQYIAHNILCHQQLIMNLTTLPANAGPQSIYKAKAPTPDALISKLIKSDGDEFTGEFMGKKKFSALAGDKTCGAGNNVNVFNNKQLMFQQTSQQITTANVLGPTLVGQLGQHQTLMVPPTNQNASALLTNSVKGALLSSSLSPVVNYNHINLPSKPIPPYMTIYPNNGYPSPFSSANRGDQAPVIPYVNRSYSLSPPHYVSQTQPQQSLS
ncbi:hypothetical protein Leryth_009052 [Lithospermum erythrorhizon]|nr:hypothetical protein Leryth_009052 [Lithospermum erythrorhizon]